MGLRHVLESNKTIRSIGFDDAPFERGGDRPVGVAGVVCKSTRFDGMVWGEIEQDGLDATEMVCDMLEGSKFCPQLHVVLVDGIAFGGFNVLDLKEISERLELPAIALMRDRPDFDDIRGALKHVSKAEQRFETMRRAGEIYERANMYFQVRGTSRELAGAVIARLQRAGHIPEPLRISHLIASAVETGESGRRA